MATLRYTGGKGIGSLHLTYIYAIITHIHDVELGSPAAPLHFLSLCYR